MLDARLHSFLLQSTREPNWGGPEIDSEYTKIDLGGGFPKKMLGGVLRGTIKGEVLLEVDTGDRPQVATEYRPVVATDCRPDDGDTS